MVVSADSDSVQDGTPAVALSHGLYTFSTNDGLADTGVATVSEAVEDRGAEEQAGTSQQQIPRKRRRPTAGSDFRQALLTEQRMLRESFEACHAREMELRQRHLMLSFALVACSTVRWQLVPQHQLWFDHLWPSVAAHTGHQRLWHWRSSLA